MAETDYEIFVDAAADISPAVAKENNIKFIPMEYSLGDEMRKSTFMEDHDTLKKFYNGQRFGALTKTTQISPFMYTEIIEPSLKAGKPVLYLSLSGGLSNTYQSAMLAKAELGEKYPDVPFIPIDTLSATGGIGVLAERAIRNRHDGMGIWENAADISEATHRIRHWFLVQDLMYLKRGGRIGGAAAMVGTMLNVRPILKIDENGKLVNFAKKRGNKQAVAEILAKYAETADPAPKDPVYVIDADDEELGSELEAELRKAYPGLTIRRCVLCPIIGAHTGPGMAAVCHLGR